MKAHRVFRTTAAVAASLAVWIAAPLRAEGDSPLKLQLSGFGTAGAITSSERHADLLVSAGQPSGVGLTRRVDFGLDSRLGAQADVTFNERLSAVVQVVAQRNFDNSSEPQVEWANLKYAISSNWDARLGRFASPVLMTSDYRLVGYANLFLRPPPDVYQFIPVTHIDGVDTTFRSQFGGVSNAVHASFGRSHQSLGGPGQVREDTVLVLVDSVEYRSWTVRASLGHARMTNNLVSVNALIDGYRALGATLAAIPGQQPAANAAAQTADFNRVDRANARYSSLGIAYDRDPWVLAAEWLQADAVAYMGRIDSGYVMGGFRVGQWTPYAIWSAAYNKVQPQSGVPLAGLPAPLIPAAAALDAGLHQQIAAFGFDRRTTSIGLRWDPMKNVDLKLQFDRMALGEGGASNGFVGAAEPGFRPPSHVSLIGFTVDFIF